MHYDALYRLVDLADAPWAGGTPNALLLDWIRSERRPPLSARVLVTGCGLGGDAVYLAEEGYRVVAFDNAPAAIRLCRERHPSLAHIFSVNDIREPPRHWRLAFDLVYDAFALQTLPIKDQPAAMVALAGLVRKHGSLLLVGGRSKNHPLSIAPPEALEAIGARFALVWSRDVAQMQNLTFAREFAR